MTDHERQAYRHDRGETTSSLVDGIVIAVVRGRSGAHLDAVVDTLAECGLGAIELTLNTPGALAALGRAGERGVPAVIGAGTVMSASQLDEAADRGAAFAVGPHTDMAVAERARVRGVPYVPGALTPGEVVAAWSAGVAAVKLFPARLGGPAYLRDLREPLDGIPIVPSGGVSADNMTDWFDAGAASVCVGGALIGDALITGDVGGLRQRANRLVEINRARLVDQ